MEDKSINISVPIAELERMDTPLTPLQHKFVMEYIKDGNAAKAMERAGAKGTKSTFKNLGYQMIHNQSVQNAIKEAQGKIIQKASLERQDIVNHLMDTAREARVAKKFDAAVRSYQQVAELHGWINKQTKKDLDKEEKNKPMTATDAFSNGEGGESVTNDQEIIDFLRLVKPKASQA